jgi:putative hydrolase of the HAD superfamily
MTKRIKAVIFDLNGVFINSPVLSQRLEVRYGIPADELWPVLKEILKKTRLPETRTASDWDPLLKLIKTTKEELFTFWFSGETLNSELLQYAGELISAGYEVILLSNNFPERTAFYRQNFPTIFALINKAYFSWETGLIKPDPRAFSLLLSENKLAPGECVYFDDSEDNINSAKSLGIHSYIYNGLPSVKKIIADLG